MTRREKRYHKRTKPQKGFSFRPFSYPSYDNDFKMPINDEPGYFKNFAIMIPKKAIKLPSKKEIKKLWYAGRWHWPSSPIRKPRKPWEKIVTPLWDHQTRNI